MIWLLLACNKDNKCSSDEQFFSEQAAPLLNQRCYGCHQSNGLAQDSRLVLQPLERESANTKNWISQISKLIDRTDLISAAAPPTCIAIGT